MFQHECAPQTLTPIAPSASPWLQNSGVNVFRTFCGATPQTWRLLFLWSWNHNPEQAASTNNLVRPILPVNTSVEPTTHRSRTHYMIRNLPNKLHIVTLRGQQLQLSATFWSPQTKPVPVSQPLCTIHRDKKMPKVPSRIIYILGFYSTARLINLWSRYCW